jgi:arabinofuranan 3-O-arabinosyltransferase
VAGAPQAASPDPAASTGAACGFGPSLIIGGRTYATRVDGTIGDVLDGRPLTWALCDASGVEVPAGSSALQAQRTAQFVPVRLLLAPSGDAGPGQVQNATVSWVSPTEFGVPLSGLQAPSVIVVPQNFSRGWVGKSSSGATLAPIRVNGWQQGWVVPAGAGGELHATFSPDAAYRRFLGLGALLVLAAAGLALASRRREGMPPLEPATRLRWAAPVLGVLLVLGFGWPGLVGALWGAVVGRTSWTRRAPLVIVLLGSMSIGALLAASRVWPSGPGGVDSLVVQLATLVAVGTVAGSAMWALVGSPRRPHRIRGRSMQ